VKIAHQGYADIVDPAAQWGEFLRRLARGLQDGTVGCVAAQAPVPLAQSLAQSLGGGAVDLQSNDVPSIRGQPHRYGATYPIARTGDNHTSNAHANLPAPFGHRVGGASARPFPCRPEG